MEKQYAPSQNTQKLAKANSTSLDKKVTAPKAVVAAPIQAKKEEKKVDELKTDIKVEDVKKENEQKESKDSSTAKKKVEVKRVAKEKAVVHGYSLTISPKHSYAICDMIRYKTPDQAIEMLEQVVIKKRAVPMNNREIPHRHGDLMAGRYPLNASKEFILLLKQLKANADVNMIENPVITFAVANRASRPQRRGGVRGKRAHVTIEVMSRTNLANLKQEKLGNITDKTKLNKNKR